VVQTMVCIGMPKSICTHTVVCSTCLENVVLITMSTNVFIGSPETSVTSNRSVFKETASAEQRSWRPGSACRGLLLPAPNDMMDDYDGFQIMPWMKCAPQLQLPCHI
jgi:hypothetical protein